MSLVDLKSDLSKFRQTVSKDEKDSPASSKATDVNNFATLQPITDKLSQLRPTIGEWKTSPIESLLDNTKLDDIKKPTSNFTPLEKKLGNTKLDDIKKNAIKNGLINSVSKLSPINNDFNTGNIIDVYEEDVVSEIAKLRKEQFKSKLNKSEIEVKRFDITETQFSSKIEINDSQKSFDRTESTPNVNKNIQFSNNITDPKIEINSSEKSFDRKSQSPTLNSKGIILPNDDITIPNIDTDNRPALFNNLGDQSVVIDKELFSPLNNIINPEISLQRKELFFDRDGESPDINNNVNTSGIVKDPKIKISKTDLSSAQEKDNSELNLDGKISKYNINSKLATMTTTQIVDTIRYDLKSKQLKDNSEFNPDVISRINPSGRNNNPTKSEYSTVGTQEVNFFKNTNSNGFIANAEFGKSEYKKNSDLTWNGKNVPSVNFIQDNNAIGFKTFVDPQKTLYIQNTSKFGFEDIPQTDFFDISKRFTLTGFKSFSKQYNSDYRIDSSTFSWVGKRSASPEVNYFDIKRKNTKVGFHKFASIYDSKYNEQSSDFNWDGKRESAPVVNYFDITKRNTKDGFHKFAGLLDSKYVRESSIYDWNGKGKDAPSVNYFDLIGKFTTLGFETFAPFLETKYISDSSGYDWDGIREQAPSINYFDISSKVTTAGFQTFAPFLETKYIPDASNFDWNGTRTLAPEINYFDVLNQYTKTGFHRFAGLLDSKYVPDASIYDWNGIKQNSPSVNYFDLIGKFTTAGFHTFAPFLETKYISDSSDYDWDGTREQAPEIDYFDLTKRNTTVGFHKFAGLLDSKYVAESSDYDWDGTKQDSPAVNYFDLTKQNTTAGFHTLAPFLETKYIPESSVYDWNGFRKDAPFVNYFDLTDTKKTTSGFHTFAQLYDSKYVPESSRFDWNGARSNAPFVDYFDLTDTKKTTAGFHTFAQLYDTKYVAESSRFDWDGARNAAPFVDYFDLTDIKKTTSGFHTFAQLYDSKYVPESSIYDWDGTPKESLNNFVDLFQNTNATGFTKFPIPLLSEYVKESSRFDWDGARNAAPSVNYFDTTQTNRTVSEFPNGFIAKTTAGFHTFAQMLDSKYIPGSSKYDWDGNPRQSLQNLVDMFPNVNATGFTKFALPLVSEYVNESSKFDWDGSRNAAPSVNYFDTSNTNRTVSEFPNGFIAKTTAGFHTFAQMLDSKYIPGSSKYDWDNNPRSSLENIVDVFKNTNATGFTKFAIPLLSEYLNESSRFDWDGARSAAPSINYFPDKNADGFFTFSPLLKSYYKKDTTFFGWKGVRQDAPEVGFFGALVKPNTSQNPIVITNLGGLTTSVLKPGFKKFFIDKTKTNLSSDFSYYSTESGTNKSKINGIPVTNFFGFVPEKRAGFTVNLSTYDGTLYPIIEPELKYNFDAIQRNLVETLRSSNGLTLNNREEYVPKTLGKKLWTSGNSTVFASLTNQVPESKVNAESSYYGKPYAKTMKDVTESKGYLAKWAITRNSPSPLDEQYSKFNLRDDAYESGFVGDQPFVLRDIGQKWGFGVNFDEGLIRGGAVTMAERALYDVQRIGKWLISTKGLLWNVKQVGLQLMNPNVDTDPQGGVLGSVVDFLTTFGMSPTQIFNPLSTVINVAGNAIGLRVPRHSLLGAIDSRSLNRYETSTINRELYSPPNDTVINYFKGLETPVSDGDQTNYSRLIGLMKELLPHSFRSLYPDRQQSDDFLGHSKIHRISTSFGGPNAPLGIGGTKIRRARHPYLTYYTTDGNIPSGFEDATYTTPNSGNELFSSGGTLTYLGTALNAATSNPAYPDTARRTQFYNHYDKTGEKPNKYSDVVYENYVKTNKNIFGDIRGLASIFKEGPVENGSSFTPYTLRARYEITSSMPSETITRIKGLNPFNPTRKTFLNNIKAVNPSNASTFNLDPLEGSPISETDNIKKYLTATYSNLRTNNSGSRKFNDFRYDIVKQSENDNRVINTFVGRPSTANGYYKNRNMEDYFGMGRQGEPGNVRDNLTNTTIEYNRDATIDGSVPVLKKDQKFRGDRINILDYKRSKANITTDLVYERGKYKNNTAESSVDLIEFYFSGVNLKGSVTKKTEILPFRATFGNISDSHSPKWNPIKYMGRGDPLYVYDGYERSISFDFVVHIGSRDELKASWRKLNYLASWTAPDYTKAGLIRGPLIRLNIGHLYRKLPGFINSLSYTFDNTGTTWETANLPLDYKQIGKAVDEANTGNNYSSPGALQLPKHVQISVGYTPVGVYRPEYNGIMYQLYDDSDADIETGLMPGGDDKVNYFRTYDSVPSINDPANKELLKVPVGEENMVQDIDPNLKQDESDFLSTVIDINKIIQK